MAILKDVGQSAQDALRRMLGERIVEETPFNAGTPRDAAAPDEVGIQTDLQGKSHQAYIKKLADEKAAREALAAQQEAARQAAIAASKPVATAAAGSTAAAQGAAVAPAPVVAQEQLSQGYFMPRKTYQSYFSGNQDALSKAYYKGTSTATTGSNDPYRFRNEYNRYLDSTLQQERDKLNAQGKALTYDQYYAGNTDAMSRTAYRSNSATSGDTARWGSNGNPYRYSNEYNKYLDSKGYKMGQSTPFYTKLGTTTPYKAMSYI